MDKEYIERRALLKTLSEKSNPWAHYIDAIFVAEKFPVAADVVEVKHGRWINTWISGVQHYRCTECDEYIEGVWTANFDYLYCPNCGAKMDGENNE